jgi:uncharacterized membrane protein YGL010W
MRQLDSYLSEYQESHQHPTNIKLHNVCVPLIMWSILVFLSSFSMGPLPASILLLAVVIVFYSLIAKFRTIFFMTSLSAAMILSYYITPSPRAVSISVFAVAWIGQFYGHKIEGKKPSFFKDLLFLLIGPVWVAKKLIPGAVQS